MNESLSVTIVAASPGTTGSDFLNRMLATLNEQRVTAIIPARGEQKPHTKNGISMIPTTERFKRLGQGCSCCTVRSDLMTKIRRISQDRSADHIVIQLAPNSDLDTLGKTFTVPDTDGSRLLDIASLESVITVINADSVHTTLESNARPEFIDRLRYSSTLVIENTAETTPEMYAQAVSTIQGINPSARIITNEKTAPMQHTPAPLQCNLPS